MPEEDVRPPAASASCRFHAPFPLFVRRPRVEVRVAVRRAVRRRAVRRGGKGQGRGGQRGPTHQHLTDAAAGSGPRRRSQPQTPVGPALRSRRTCRGNDKRKARLSWHAIKRTKTEHAYRCVCRRARGPTPASGAAKHIRLGQRYPSSAPYYAPS